jgi:Thioredoxin reductase
METHAIVIIGAGTAGLTAALYLKRANQDFVLLEKGAPGGKLLTVSEISNYPGVDKVPGFVLAQMIYKTASDSGVEVTPGSVQSVSRSGKDFLVATDNGDYLAKAVLVATGLSNVPTLKGEKNLLGRGVSYCATCDGPLYRKKDVALIGEGERSLVEALYLVPLVNQLLVLVPGESLSGDEALKEKLLQTPNVTIIYGSKALEILGAEHVEGVLYEVKGARKQSPVSAVFPLLGEKSASSFLSPLSIRTEKGFLPVDSNMMSSVPGLFAAGDIVEKPLRQVVTAAGDGANASSGIMAYLRQGANV